MLLISIGEERSAVWLHEQERQKNSAFYEQELSRRGPGAKRKQVHRIYLLFNISKKIPKKDHKSCSNCKQL